MAVAGRRRAEMYATAQAPRMTCPAKFSHAQFSGSITVVPLRLAAPVMGLVLGGGLRQRDCSRLREVRCSH